MCTRMYGSEKARRGRDRMVSMVAMETNVPQKDLTNHLLNDCEIYNPGKLLTEAKPQIVCASDLRVGSDEANAHFISVKMMEEHGLQTLKDNFSTYMNSISSEQIQGFLKCKTRQLKADILTKRNFLLQRRVSSEAALSYIICDPIMEAMCNYWGLCVELEETVETSSEMPVNVPLTPGCNTSRAVASAISAGYSLYTLKNSKGQVVAVVIEAKLIKHSKISHAVAQAIGYHVKLPSSYLKQPLVLVVTEDYIRFVFFPFQDDDGHILVNAVVTDKIRLFDGEKLHKKVLENILLLSTPNTSFKVDPIILPKEMTAVKKTKITDVILTDAETNQMLHEKLQAKDEKLQAKDEKLQAQEEKLQAKDEKLQAKDEKLQAQEEKLQAQEEKHQKDLEKLKKKHQTELQAVRKELEEKRV